MNEAKEETEILTVANQDGDKMGKGGSGKRRAETVTDKKNRRYQAQAR
jgi:hypothetical protein